MANILFTHSYFLRLDPKQWATAQPYAPLGTLYAAAYIRDHGYNVSLFDVMFEQSANSLAIQLNRLKPEILVIYDDGFNYLTKMCLENMREAAFDMIRLAKERGCTVIVSSSDSTDRFNLYLDKGADYILLGEAEATLLELVRGLEDQQADLHLVEGLAFKQNGEIIKTGRRNVLKDLDALCFPAWDLINMAPYKDIWYKNHGYFSINMATTRGCPFKCNWCAKPIYGNRYNSRSPNNVMEELLMLKEKFEFEHIWFCDDIFGLKPGWIKDFADLVEKEEVAFKFKIQGRVDLLLKENNILDLKRAGCDNIWMGAESGSQKILDAMDKGTTVQQIFEATRLLKKFNIRPSFFIQFGYLTETKADIAKTIAMINELLPSEIGISVSYPLPGTVFYEKVKNQLINKTNWKDSDELALMFTNTYKPVFYKQLHRYVHKTYRKHLAMDMIKQIFYLSGNLSAHKIKKALSFFYYVPAAFIAKQKLQLLESHDHAITD